MIDPNGAVDAGHRRPRRPTGTPAGDRPSPSRVRHPHRTDVHLRCRPLRRRVRTVGRRPLRRDPVYFPLAPERPVHARLLAADMVTIVVLAVAPSDYRPK